MKRILAILCVIAVLCGLCVPAMAAGTITVSVKAPAEWTEVYLYVWETDAMVGWPGTAMTKGSDGFWTLEIPAGSYTNVIANNGEGKPQTADLKMDGSANCWIVAEAGAGAVYTDAACTKPFGGSSSAPSNPGAGVNLSGLNSLALVGGGIPGLKEWAPEDNNGDFVKVSDGVYSKVITVVAGLSMQIKFAGNDKWDDNYNFGPSVNETAITLGTKMEMVNGAGAQNFALTTTKDCNLKFTVDLTGATPTVLVEETTDDATVAPPSEPSEPSTPSTPSGDTYTLHAMVPADWKNPCIWCWDGNSTNPSDIGSWPGNYTMKQDADGWWTIQIPAGYTNVLVNANSGAVQTIDITGLTGQEVWIDAVTNTAQPTVHYDGAPTVTIPEETEPSATTGRPTIKPAGKTDEGAIDWAATLLYAGIGSAVVVVIAAIVLVLILVLKKRK